MKRWMFFLLASCVCLVCGLLAGVVSLVATGDFDDWGAPPDLRLVVPGDHCFELEDSGLYYLYHEYHAVIDSIDYSIDSIPHPLGFTLTNSESREVVPLIASDLEVRYTYPDRAGVTLLQFNAALPGSYELDAGYETGEAQPELVIAVGAADVFGGDMATSLAVFVVVFLVMFLASLVIWRMKFGRVAQGDR